MKSVYVTATRRSDGKTSITLGLTLALRDRIRNIGFIKPLGRGDVGHKGSMMVDEDTALIAKACGVHAPVKAMSPVAIDAGFIEQYFKAGAAEDLMAHIHQAYEEVSEDKDLMVIEGTGHACVGETYGLSNARVARELGAPVVLVSSGGVGQPIDEIALNLQVFEKHGVKVLGVIINKAYPHEVDVLKDFGRRALERMGTRLLGVVPYVPELIQPTVLQVARHINGEILNGSSQLGAKVKKLLIGAMTPHNAIPGFENGALLITPGDRSDMILAAASTYLFRPEEGAPRLSGLVLTVGVKPPDPILGILAKTELPVILTQENSFKTASRIDRLEPAISPSDRETIDRIADLVRTNVDVAGLYDSM